MSGIALKVTSLLVRTVAKPIANGLKAQAKNNEGFKRTCIRIAQTVHATDVRLRMKLLGENKIKIRPLNDKKAIESGANFLSETFIFSVAGLLIFYESYRSRKKLANEKQNVKNDISELQDDIEEVKSLLKLLSKEIDHLQAATRQAADEAQRKLQSPPTPSTPTPQLGPSPTTTQTSSSTA